jgi:glycerophosphoryl diester phosphodiesterase
VAAAAAAALGLPPPPWIVGHRGAAGEAPENTLPSLLLAVEQGADMVEVDVQLTADGELVAVHDWDLTRLAGVPLVVEEATVSALRPHPVGKLGGAPCWIPRLAEILGALPPAMPLDLELKRRRADRERLAEALLATLAAAGGRHRLLVSSFDWHLLATLRRRAPALALAPIADRHPERLLAAGRELGAATLHCHRRLATRALAGTARRARRPLLAYTVNEPRAARRLFAVGVTGIFTDHPGALRRALLLEP